jgi:hypothetical protein
MDLKSVIDKINTKNNTVLFEVSKTVGLSQFLSTLTNLTYLGHGGMCLCLLRQGVEVVKCCKKTKKAIISSTTTFNSRVEELRQHNISVLYPIEVLYEDEYWFVYTQPACRIIERADFSVKMGIQMLDFIEQMIKSNLKMTDIFYRNFGIYRNQLFLFDYHEIESFDTASSFMINNLYSTFILLGKNIGWHTSEIFAPHTHFPEDGNYGEYKFPREVIKFLSAMRENDHPKMIDYINRLRTLLKTYINKKYSDMNHQHITITGSGDINLSSQSITKFELTEKLVSLKGIKSILESRCGIGGLGLKLAQCFPDIKVTLSNSDIKELAQAKQIATDCMVFNTNFIGEPKPSSHSHKYDLVLYYSSVHHLLKTQTMAELIDDLKLQMNKYCILEVPMMGDSLLDRVMKGAPNVANYRCLSSPETFRFHLLSNDLKVLQCIRINYNRKDLIRFAYICCL